MKERGLIFNGEMVRAILDCRKTQTRRIMKVQPENAELGLRRIPRLFTVMVRSDVGAHLRRRKLASQLLGVGG